MQVFPLFFLFFFEKSVFFIQKTRFFRRSVALGGIKWQ